MPHTRRQQRRTRLARDYTIRVTGAHRAERVALSMEADLAEELREATRETRFLLHAAAVEAAPTPREGQGSKGDGVGSELNQPGGVRRFAGRFKGGETAVSLTYEVTLFVEEGELASYVETGTGLYGPLASKYPIYPSEGRALLLYGGGGGNVSGVWLGNRGADAFDGGNAGDKLPIFDHVLHPGIQPRPFLARTVRDHANEVDTIYDRAVSAAIRGF